jgi:O-antigen ligase
MLFWRRVSILLLSLVTFAIPFEHKYDKLFRFFSKTLIPPDIVLPNFFDKKIYFYPSDIIALILLFVALFAFRIPFRRFFLSRSAIFLWIVFLCTCLSIVLSPLTHYPIPYFRLLHLATPFILFCFLANASTDEDKSKLSYLLLGCVIGAALIQSGIAIAQYAIQGPLGLRILGEPNSFPMFYVVSGSSWIFDHHTIQHQLIRPSGTFPHPNVLGGFLSFSIFAAYSLLSLPRWRIVSIFVIPIHFFAMCLTFSRSALFSLALGTLVWMGFHFKKNGFRSIWKEQAIRFASLTICFSLLFSWLVLHEQIRDRGGIVNYNALSSGSDTLRLSYQKIALKVIKDYPIFGAGFQQLAMRSLDYIPKDQKIPTGATHNIYLYLAGETGLISLAAFLFFIFSLLWAAIKSPFSPLLASLTAIFVAFLFIGGCDFYPLLFQQGKLPFFLAAALLAVNSIAVKFDSVFKRASA